MQSSVTDSTRAAQPKILVLGATGATGRLIVSQAVARGYDVVASFVLDQVRDDTWVHRSPLITW
ncbi:hypothetical protein WMF04_32860 [Sorangium sp. So ce260]